MTMKGLKERRSGAPSKFSQTASRLYSRTVIVNALRLFWIVLIIWGELGTFFWSLSSCKWPDAALSASNAKPTHVLLLSDTQVQPPAAMWRSATWVGWLQEFIVELSLKKSWHVATRLSPHLVIFLGDMLSDGKNVRTSLQYEQYTAKFRSIFQTDSTTPMYFLPGNNDVGMGVSQALSKNIRRDYSEAFGPFNQRIIVRNHTFICLDAPGLVDEDYQRAAQGMTYKEWPPLPSGPIEFVRSLDTGNHPTVLLSHIPLSRPDSASCGPLRERGNIHKGVGHGYQNTLGKQTTAFLFESIHPSIIFSGDNRDYCEYTHHLTDGSHFEDVCEVTVKSFSITRHIRRPGFQLLSVVDPSSKGGSGLGKSFQDHHCLLPNQYEIYKGLYLPLAFLTIAGLFVLNLRRFRRLGKVHEFPPPLLPRSSSSNLHLSLNPSPSASGTWSPYGPPVPVSPRGSLPSTLRTPNPNSGPSQRSSSASHPSTPMSSAHPHLLTPSLYQNHEDDEDAAFGTSQYVTVPAPGAGASPDDSWSPDQHFDTPTRLNFLNIRSPFLEQSEFVFRPGDRPKSERWSVSYTFAFRGRMRRITLRVPRLSREALGDLLGLLEGQDSDVKLKRRGIVRSTILDVSSVAWIAALTWSAIAWRMF